MSWRRWDDKANKRGGIEITTSEMPKKIFGWIGIMTSFNLEHDLDLSGDNQTKFKKDFRLAGIRNNDKGNYTIPEMPEYPPGYPDKAPVPPPADVNSRLDSNDLDLESEKKTGLDKAWMSEMIQFMENHDFGDSEIDLFKNQFCGRSGCPRADPIELLQDYQVQLNTYRRTEVHKLGHNRYSMEV